MNQNGMMLLHAMNGVRAAYIQEAKETGKERTEPRMRYFAAAACLCLALLGALRAGLPGALRPKPPMGPAVVPVESEVPGEVHAGTETQSPDDRQVTIRWQDVVVNESAGLGMDATRLYMDPALYEAEHWDMDQVREYFGWELAPAYIPEGLTGGGQGVGLTIYRDKATGELLEDQAGRGFWVDCSPKSDDDIVIPKGFTVTASKLGILHCGLLPVEEERITQFDRTDVTITHASLPYGPFDPTQKDPSGLYNKPAGYYDVYVAAFTLNGVVFEVETHRLELEELIKITASIISPTEDIIVGVGCGMP